MQFKSTLKMSLSTRCLLCRLSLSEAVIRSKSHFVKYIVAKANIRMSAVMTGYGNVKLINGNEIPSEVSSFNIFLCSWFNLRTLMLHVIMTF